MASSTTATRNSSVLRNTALKNITVVGFGLIGASFAAAVREADPDVHILAVDIDDGTRARALENDWANEAVRPEDDAFQRFVKSDCDLVMLSVPVDMVEGYLNNLEQWGFSGIITDTTSTKTHVSEMADSILSHPEKFIPGHPMAGSEQNGIEGARADLFKGAHWILCPDVHTSPDDFAALHELISSIGARVISLPREQHDDAVAIVSHVPHIVAASLMQLATSHADDQQALMRLAAGGFKDTTRVAAGSPDLWCGIAFDNREAVAAGLGEISGIIEAFEQALRNNDRDALFELLEQPANARRALPTAWVPSTDKLLEVRIPMLDRPGVVAEVTTIASEVGCNIQSIEIDHVTEDSAVLSLVLTDEGDIGQLSCRLIEAGFSVSFNPLAPKEHVHVE